MSSRCAASSSIVCDGRSRAPFAAAWRFTRVFQSCRGVMRSPLRRSSGVLHDGELSERGDEPRPVGALLGEHLPAGLGDAVVAAAALAGLLDPAALDPAAVLEPVEGRVEGGEREAQPAIGPLLDQLRDLVPVVALVFDNREDDQLGAALLRFLECARRHAGPLYAGALYITL